MVQHHELTMRFLHILLLGTFSAEGRSLSELVLGEGRHAVIRRFAAADVLHVDMAVVHPVMTDMHVPEMHAPTSKCSRRKAHP